MKMIVYRRLLLSFFFLASPAFADGSACEPQTENLEKTLQKTTPDCREAMLRADKCCREPKSDGCGFKEPAGVPNVLPSEGAYGAAVQQTGRLVRAKNENNAFAAICRAGHRKAAMTCINEVDKWTKIAYNDSSSESQRAEAEEQLEKMKPNREIRSAAFKKYHDCHQNQADQNSREVDESLKSANNSMGDSRWRVVCDPIEIQGSTADQCMLYNDGDSKGSILSGADKDNQEVKAIPLGNGCSGYTDAKGNLYSAAHCSEEAQISTIKNPDGSTSTGAWRDRELMDKDVPAGAYNAIYKFDDQVSYRAVDGVNDANFNGKPFYTLTHDPSMNSGCAVRGAELACSESALTEIQGTQAKILGYPGTYFSGSKPYLDKQGDQLLTEGPAYYDANVGQMRVVANVQPGNSGGPTYFPSQTTIGGVTSDRPIVVGPTSGANQHAAIGGNSYSLNFNRVSANVPVIATGARTIRAQSTDETLLNGGTIFKNPPRK